MASTLQDRQPKASLLGIPFEIRRKIYNSFIQLNDPEYSCMQYDEPRINFEIPGVCRQVRDEAWQSWCDSNMWVQVLFFSQKGQQPLTCIYPWFPANDVALRGYQGQMLSELTSKITLTLYIGHKCGEAKSPNVSEATERHIVPHTRSTWIYFCAWLAQRTDCICFSNLSVEVGQRYLGQGSSSWPTETLLPLAMVRRANKVHFNQLMQYPLYARMAEVMTAKDPPPEEFHQLLIGIKEMQSSSVARGDAAFALLWFRVAGLIRPIFRPQSVTQEAFGLRVFTPPYNVIKSLRCDIAFAAASIYHDQIEHELRNVTSYSSCRAKLDAMHEVCGMNADSMWTWPGMSSEQHMRIWEQVKTIPEHPSGGRDEWLDSYIWHLKLAASREFWYASKFCEWHQTSVRARELFEELNNEFGADAETDEFINDVEMVEKELPGFGRWKASFGFWECWKSEMGPGFDMARCADIAMLECTEGELEDLSYQLGISGRVKPLSLMRFIA